MFGFFLPLPPASSGVLGILCKSSNQHAQILFNFTASRVALISSSYLDCALFESNGRVSKTEGGPFLAFATVLKSPVSEQII